MSSKRPHEDGPGGPSKKPKSDAVSLYAKGDSFPYLTTHIFFYNLLSALNQSSTMPTTAASAAELIARKRAEVAAKMANFSAQQTTKPTVLPTLAPPIPKPTPPPASASLPPRPSTSIPAGIDPDLAKKIAEAKRRADASRANVEINSNPYLAAAVAATAKKSATGSPAPQAPIGTGLKMAAHPLLLDTAPAPAATSKNNRYKPMQPKFASIKANTRNVVATPPPPPPPVAPAETKVNPYTSGTASPAPEPTATGVSFGAPKERSTRGFRFNQKGKYVALGQQMRQDAQLEELKKRIAENARKAGLDSEFETLEKTIKIEAPPDVEWWDVSLLPETQGYNDIVVDGVLDISKTNIRKENSPITLYVQHPIPIPSPWDKNKVELKPAKLTKKEMKKMRRQRRMAEMQDKQDRQKMGLIPPDPPKVRLANLMRVLTSDAVQDPTKVEARVRREVAMRKKGHDDMNATRKLTDEQRREKIEAKKVEQEKKGIYAAVYKIKNLSDPSHRFKVRKNAEQYGLTGVCIFNPAFNLVLVEGSYKAIEKYSRLMTVRIQWTEAAREKDAEEDEGEGEGEGEQRPPPRVKQEEGFSGPTSLEDNRCDKVWEGPIREHTYKSFKAKSCPTDSSSKEFLGEKMASYWDVAKLYIREDEL
ncbi:hypothetical protein FRC02_008393 [Tulasnella sp. 418]|nr:hypothetical protein FRC02_008393 [Tulasnella sp. 418]